MPNIKSAIKRAKSTQKKSQYNKSQRTEVRTIVKMAKTAIENNSSDAKEAVDKAIVKIDKAAGKGKIHKNTAARKKSRLTKALNAIE